jgi:hypothetical protein
MIMKKYFGIVFIIAMACRLLGQNEPRSNEWHLTLNVVDEAGAPVPGAKASVSYFVPPPVGKPIDSIASETITGLTGEDGVFKATHRDRSISLSFRVQKDGFYRSDVVDQLGPPMNYDPVRWNPTLTIELKKISQPIAMYAQRLHWITEPRITNQRFGYDLTMGDWTLPYGKGQRSDIIFMKEFQGKAPYDYLSRLTVSFPNQGDGIQSFSVPYPIMQGSLLRSAHQAPTDGYQPQLIKEESAHPGQPTKEPENDQNRGYYIRVQTILDASGNVKSALYGKLYGDFMQFTYYLNPTPNDRNIEFDPNRNLLRNLPPADRVTAP